MAKTVDWYIGLAAEMAREFQPLVTVFEKIDDMVRPTWNLPAEFTAVIKDVMAIVDTAPSDAINSGAIALSSTMPIFSVSPFSASPQEYDRAQKMEDNIGFHFRKANTRGTGTFMYDTAESSLRYNTIAARVDDLVHILPKNPATWSPIQKQAWSMGRFIMKALNPKRVRYLFSDFGLTLVNTVDQFRVMDVINYWRLYEDNSTKEGKRVMQTVKELDDAVGGLTAKGKEKGSFALSELYFNQEYMIDHDRLVVWGSLATSSGEKLETQLQGIPASFVFADQDNPYGFIPFSIRVAGSRIEEKLEYRVNPLLAPLYWSKSWDKLNLAKSIIFSEPIRRARSPRGYSETMDGNPVKVDHENGSDIALKTNEKYVPFNPITIDAQALAVVGQLEAAMNRTTGASVIGDTTKISSNTPFSTFSAMVKVALSRLDKQRGIMGDTASDVAGLYCKWVYKTDHPLESYASGDKRYRSGTNVPRGQKIEITKNDFNLESLGISSKVVPSTPTDRMEQLNMAVIMSTKLNMPVSQLLEEMGYENVGLAYELWAREFLTTADIQGQAAAIQQKYIMDLQAQQAAQMQAGAQGSAGGGENTPPSGNQDPMGAGGGISETSFGQLGGAEGFNPAMGGNSPTTGAPTMGREQVTGQTQMQR